MIMELENLLCCPITKQIMINPVICSDNYTYEKNAILAWLEKNTTSPITRQPMLNIIYVNYAIKDLIELYNNNQLISITEKSNKKIKSEKIVIERFY